MKALSVAKLRYVLCGAIFIGLSSVASAENQVCVYQGADGSLHQAKSLGEVPISYREGVQCFQAGQNQYMAAPDDISLKGNTRSVYMPSALGRIELRWPRSVEVLFGRTPERAVGAAALAASKALHSASFPISVQTLSADWKIVFMDENVSAAEIPQYLVSNCHPAWMTPPANIYVAAQRVVAGCGAMSGNDTKVNDAQLAQVLIHEMGHAIEYAMVGNSQSGDRMRAEGFACWFEQYASDYSAVNSRGSARNYYSALARQSFTQSPGEFQFEGSAYDYARASMYFHAIVKRRGVSGLVGVYDAVQKGVGFFDAVTTKVGITPKELNEAARDVAK